MEVQFEKGGKRWFHKDSSNTSKCQNSEKPWAVFNKKFLIPHVRNWPLTKLDKIDKTAQQEALVVSEHLFPDSDTFQNLLSSTKTY